MYLSCTIIHKTGFLMLEVNENRKCKVYGLLKIQCCVCMRSSNYNWNDKKNAVRGCLLMVTFSVVFSLYSKPAGMPPYAAPQGFPFLPPYPPQETNRTMAAVPISESVSSSYTTDKPAAPSYGLITDLPLPVPTAEVVLQVCVLRFAA